MELTNAKNPEKIGVLHVFCQFPVFSGCSSFGPPRLEPGKYKIGTMADPNNAHALLCGLLSSVCTWEPRISRFLSALSLFCVLERLQHDCLRLVYAHSLTATSVDRVRSRSSWVVRCFRPVPLLIKGVPGTFDAFQAIATTRHHPNRRTPPPHAAPETCPKFP